MSRIRVLLPLLGLDAGVFLIFAMGMENKFWPFLVWPLVFFVAASLFASILESLGIERLWYFVSYPLSAVIWAGLAIIVFHFAQICGLVGLSFWDSLISWKDLNSALVGLLAILFTIGIAQEIARSPRVPLARV